MTIATARLQGIQLLERAGVPVPQLTAEVLLCHALRCERSYLYGHPEQELREVEWLHYGRYLHERMQGKPTQYVTKQQEFFGRVFRVEPGVLIPRPETEHLVEAVLDRKPLGRIVDIGTGSGAIAITLALELGSNVVATDISAAALKVARHNRDKLKASVAFVETDLLDGFEDASLDCVVSNPPYVPEAEKATLAQEVRDWEPHLALFGGESGLKIYQRLTPQAWRVLRPGGLLAMEIGSGEWDAVRAMLEGWRDASVLPDLAGIPRVALARKP